MSEEFGPSNYVKIAEGLINRPGGSPEGFIAVEEIFDKAVERGIIRSEISCEEIRREWFISARSTYVDNNPEPRFPIDAETSLHLGGCNAPICLKLSQVYWQVLRPSQPEDSGAIAEYLDRLETEISDNPK